VRLLLVLIAVLTIAGAAVAGYLLGENEAPDPSEAHATEEAAFQEAAKAAKRTAAVRSRKKGTADGREIGQRAGARAGALDGRTKGDARASSELAALAPPPVPETPPLVQLPNNELGYALPPEDRSLSCVGIEAATGECVGD
jgi:hypothetical protein